MLFAGVVGGIASAVLTSLSGVLRTGMEHISVHPLLISLICDVLVNVLYFALMMASFVLGITLGFNLMEETGYLARISFLFDHTMSKVGLQGKTIMPFFMGLGCTIAGTTGTRVVDNWGQRVLAIAMSWAVPCAATLSVVPTIAIALFGSTGGFLVIVSIFLFMFLMMWIVYKIFGNSLAPKRNVWDSLWNFHHIISRRSAIRCMSHFSVPLIFSCVRCVSFRWYPSSFSC